MGNVSTLSALAISESATLLELASPLDNFPTEELEEYNPGFIFPLKESLKTITKKSEMSTFDKIMRLVNKDKEEESESPEDLAKSLSSEEDQSSSEKTEEIYPSDSSTTDLDSDYENSKEKKRKTCKKMLTPIKTHFQTHPPSKN